MLLLLLGKKKPPMGSKMKPKYNIIPIEQVDVHVEHIGTFIRPRKETQRVKITKEEED
jgi:hypothetical protein